MLTFLFTDIEGSTKLVATLGIDRWEEVLRDHGRIMVGAIAAGRGRPVRTEGDAFFAVFDDPVGAVTTAALAERQLAGHSWPHGVALRVRMGMHTGEAKLGNAETAVDYVGFDVHKAARVASAAHGGQVLLSAATEELTRDALPVGVSARDVGVHRLKDLVRPERLFQLVIEGAPSEFPPPRSIGRAASDLPVQPTAFVGRERELAEARALLGRARVLTLLGPGGTGKTRLALQLASEVADAFDSGVAFVPLEDVVDPELVVPAIARALDLRELPQRSIQDVLRDFVRDRALLLVLDNLEQVAGCAAILIDLLTAAPRLKLVVTSRVPLRVVGEQQYAVPPLAVPEVKAALTPDELGRYSAVRLFVERARAVRPDFALTAENARAVVAICARLDGLPLALELAAARVKVLSPEAILPRLERVLAMLTTGAVGVPERQRTMRSAIAWSYDLLDEGQRRSFERLAVFSGSPSLELIEGVCGPAEEIGGDVLEQVSALVDHSLVIQREVEGEPRFAMLVPIREFALERLEAGTEAHELRRRHADAMVAMSSRAEAEIASERQGTWLARVELDHDDLRSAVRWCVERGDAERALALGGALFWSWYLNGRIAEGSELLASALALPDAGRYQHLRARALSGSAHFAWVQGDFAKARRLFGEATAIGETTGDQRALAFGSLGLAVIDASEGRDQDARRLLEHARAQAGQLGGLAGRWAESLALRWLGYLDLRRGEAAAARRSLEAALALARRIGDPSNEAGVLSALAMALHAGGDQAAATDLLQRALGLLAQARSTRDVATTLARLAVVARDRGELASAEQHCVEALAILRDLGDRSGVASAIELAATLAVARGDHRRALRLAGAAEAIRRSAATTFSPVPGIDGARWLGTANEALGEEAASMRSDGASLSEAEAVALALSEEREEVAA